MIKIKMHGENKHDKKIEKKRKQMNAGVQQYYGDVHK